MAEAERPRGLFRRLFGGGAQPAAETTPDATGGEAAAPPPPKTPPPVYDLRAALAADAAAAREEFREKLKTGLARTSGALGGRIAAIFTERKLDAETLEEFEDALIQADLGLDAAQAIVATLSRGRFGKTLGEEEVRGILAAEVEKALLPVAKPLVVEPGNRPHVILVVGVNGTGKTTTIGKLAQRFAAEGKKVVLAAGDTFRAAAIDQLKVWAQRTGARVIAREPGSDAASLAFDALTAAEADGADVLVIDTAGRLQNRKELMAELEKIIRVLKKRVPAAPHSVLLTLDATTGQNAMSQVEIFGKVAGVTGLVMTKLDGTARGGILVALANTYGLPVHFVGVGEKVGDLEPFAARDFARAIAGL